MDWIHLSFAGRGSLDLADLAIQFGALGAIAAMLVAGPARKNGRTGGTDGRAVGTDAVPPAICEPTGAHD